MMIVEYAELTAEQLQQAKRLFPELLPDEPYRYVLDASGTVYRRDRVLTGREVVERQKLEREWKRLEKSVNRSGSSLRFAKLFLAALFIAFSWLAWRDHDAFTGFLAACIALGAYLYRDVFFTRQLDCYSVDGG